MGRTLITFQSIILINVCVSPAKLSLLNSVQYILHDKVIFPLYLKHFYFLIIFISALYAEKLWASPESFKKTNKKTGLYLTINNRLKIMTI